MTAVVNLHGTEDRRPPMGSSSWKEYWESAMRRRFSKCACVNCGQQAVHGAHVRKYAGGREWYIVPLCSYHNNPANDNVMYVQDYDLVPVR